MGPPAAGGGARQGQGGSLKPARRAAALALAALAALAPPAEAARSLWHTLTHGGRERSYRVDLPDGPARGAPLLLALHGGGGNADSLAEQSGLTPLAARAGYVLAYPNGSGRWGGRLLTWNAGGGCCGYAAAQGLDDVGFLRAVIAEIETRYGTDPRRVYITGMSNGAMLAYRMACEAADVVAGIAPVAGSLHVPCAPARPVAVVAFHGTADRIVPFAGGIGTARVDRNREPDPPVTDTLAHFARIAGCSDPPRRTALAGGAVWHTVWSGCTVPIELYALVGAGHSWPGGTRVRRLLDPPSTALSASAVILEFFARR